MAEPKTEKTLVLIKPDGIQRTLIGEILKRYERLGLKLAALKMLVPTPEFIEKAMQKLKEGAELSVLHFEGQGRKKDGTVFPIEVFGRPITHNKLPARVIAVRDLTQQKQAEEEKRILQERIQRLHIEHWLYFY